MDENVLMTRLQFPGVCVSVGIGVAVQDDLAAQIANRIGLELRSRDRHHDDGVTTQAASVESNPLGMVARRGTNHPSCQLRRRQPGHFVIGAA